MNPQTSNDMQKKLNVSLWQLTKDIIVQPAIDNVILLDMNDCTFYEMLREILIRK